MKALLAAAARNDRRCAACAFYVHPTAASAAIVWAMATTGAPMFLCGRCLEGLRRIHAPIIVLEEVARQRLGVP